MIRKNDTNYILETLLIYRHIFVWHIVLQTLNNQYFKLLPTGSEIHSINTLRILMKIRQQKYDKSEGVDEVIRIKSSLVSVGLYKV